MYAVCDITTGSGFATTKLRILLLDVIDATYTVWSTVQLALFFDDLTIENSASAWRVGATVVGATDFVVRILRDDPELEVTAKT